MLCGDGEKADETSLMVHDCSIDLQVTLERLPAISEEPQDAPCIPVTRPRSFLCILYGTFFSDGCKSANAASQEKDVNTRANRYRHACFDTVIKLQLAFSASEADVIFNYSNVVFRMEFRNFFQEGLWSGRIIPWT
ncbi:MAG: hypothetical protein FDX30_06800 [Chlorobium sp.]|nr:MAG: hypothetical protein FDX30_06800 [Chlorobium sp.]